MAQPVVLKGDRRCSPEPAVSELGNLIIQHPALFRAVADLLLLFKHPGIPLEQTMALLSWYAIDHSMANDLCRLVAGFYSCDQARLDDRRGKLLEYVLWHCTPRHRAAVVEDKRHRCCLEDAHGTRIGQTNHDFDIGVLGAGFFEGYECKADVSNFLKPPSPQAVSIQCAHRRKLGYMCRTKWHLSRLGIMAHAYLAGFNASMTHEVQVLALNRFGGIDVLDATQIAEMLSCS